MQCCLYCSFTAEDYDHVIPRVHDNTGMAISSAQRIQQSMVCAYVPYFPQSAGKVRNEYFWAPIPGRRKE